MRRWSEDEAVLSLSQVVYLLMVRGHVSGRGQLTLAPPPAPGHFSVSRRQSIGEPPGASRCANETSTNVPSLLEPRVPKCLTLFLSTLPPRPASLVLFSLLRSLNELSNSTSSPQFNFTDPLSQA